MIKAASMIKALRMVMLSLLMAIAAVVGLSSAASADASAAVNACGPFSVSRCGYGGVRDSNTGVYACDTYSDGYGFFTIWWLQNGASGQIWDPDGNGGSCGSSWPGSSSNRVTSFQVCWNGYIVVCRPRMWV